MKLGKLADTVSTTLANIARNCLKLLRPILGAVLKNFFAHIASCVPFFWIIRAILNLDTSQHVLFVTQAQEQNDNGTCVTLTLAKKKDTLNRYNKGLLPFEQDSNT